MRENDLPDFLNPRANILDEYIYQAPLNGDALELDANEVHKYLVKFLEGNRTAESKFQSYLDENNGRQDFQTLVEYFKGIVVHSADIL